MSDQPETESRKIGRPSLYTDELAREALRLIAEGTSVSRAARQLSIPPSTLRTWIIDGTGLFADSPRAYDLGYDALADECLEIADDPDIPSDQKRIRIDTRLRLLGKWSKRYADKQTVEMTVRPATELTDEELARIASGSRAIASAEDSQLTH